MRRANRSAKLCAASAPGPVRGVGAVEDAPDGPNDERLAFGAEDDAEETCDPPVCWRRAMARTSEPTKGEAAVPPGATTIAERRTGVEESRSRSALGERRARRSAARRRPSVRRDVESVARSRRRATSPGWVDATRGGVDLKLRRAVEAASTSEDWVARRHIDSSAEPFVVDRRGERVTGEGDELDC